MHTNTALTKITNELSQIYLAPPAPIVKAAMAATANLGEYAMPMHAFVDEPMRAHGLGSAFFIKMLREFAKANEQPPYEEQINLLMITPIMFFADASHQHTAQVMKTLQQIIAQNARAYFAAFRGSDDKDVVEACANYVMQKHRMLSPNEINHAFQWAVTRENFNAYGSLSVAFLQSILSQYQKARNAFLSAYEDALNKPTEADKKAKELAAYKEALTELAALQQDNTRYRFFHECPHHYVTRFIADGKITVAPNRKKELYAKAAQYAARYLLDNCEHSKHAQIQQAVKDLGITPLGIPNFDVTDANGKTMLRFVFDANSVQSIAEQLKETTIIFYSKLLYFDSIMPYSSTIAK